MADLLESDAPETVERAHDGKREQATPDDDGVLRDEQGRAYSPGGWAIVDD
jgi:hypothetical protein